MTVIIDRRLNPPGKSHINRQKFINRDKARLKETLDKYISKKSIKDIAGNKNIKIKSKDTKEPKFRSDGKTGTKYRVLPGNKKFNEGDLEEKPPKSGGGAGGGPGDPNSVETEDEFHFIITKDEFLSYFFDDLELPDFVKKTLKVTDIKTWSKSGLTNKGSPANLNIMRTFKKSIGRRVALNRPTEEEVEDILYWLAKAEYENNEQEIERLSALLDEMKKKQRVVSFIDENDLRYTLYKEKPNPSSQAVMFCLMDVSGSMGVKEKDIAKRFFLLLYLFLERKYDKIDIRFIRHTHEAQDVDEETFFYDTWSGGTQISSGLTLIEQIIEKEYPIQDWNIYIAQCTDGDNYPEDNNTCRTIIEDRLQKIVQYYAYIQVSELERGVFVHPFFGSMIFSAWPMFKSLSDKFSNITCRKIGEQNQIWTVFRSLFERN